MAVGHFTDVCASSGAGDTELHGDLLHVFQHLPAMSLLHRARKPAQHVLGLNMPNMSGLTLASHAFESPGTQPPPGNTAATASPSPKCSRPGHLDPKDD